MEKFKAKSEELIEFCKTEVWRQVEGYEGLYEISNWGKIRSMDRVIIRGKGNLARKTKGVLRTPRISNRGYLYCDLYKGGKGKSLMIHNLVADTFIEGDVTRELVNHLDHNKLNNKADNFERVNHRENCGSYRKSKKYYSQYIGVSYYPKSKSWYAAIIYNNKNIYLGSFKTELEAYEARCKFEKENNVVNKYL